MKRRTDVENLPAMLFQLCKGSAANVERTFQIDVDHSSEAVWRQLFRRAQEVTCGAVHDDIDLAELFDGLCYSLFNGLGLTYISDDSGRFAAILVDSVSGGLQV